MAETERTALDDTCDVFHLDPAKVSALKTRLLSDESVGALAETFRILGMSPGFAYLMRSRVRSSASATSRVYWA